MSRKRKQYSPEFKAKVALAAIRGDKTLAEIGAQYELYPAQVNTWKRELLENASELFDKGKSASKAKTNPLMLTRLATANPYISHATTRA